MSWAWLQESMCAHATAAPGEIVGRCDGSPPIRDGHGGKGGKSIKMEVAADLSPAIPEGERTGRSAPSGILSPPRNAPFQEPSRHGPVRLFDDPREQGRAA